jgi:hypothetical protein
MKWQNTMYTGEHSVDPAKWFGGSSLQSVYFKRLVTLKRPAEAKTYDQLYELFDYGRTPEAQFIYLCRALRALNSELNGDEEALVSNYKNAQDYALKVKRPYFEDPTEDHSAHGSGLTHQRP